MLFIFVWFCSSLLQAVFMFMSRFYVFVVSFSIVITLWGKREPMPPLFRNFYNERHYVFSPSCCYLKAMATSVHLLYFLL